MDMTLEELRAANALEEQLKGEAPPQDANQEVDQNAADDLNDSQGHADDQGNEDDQQQEPESWMKGDDQESPGKEKKFSDSDIGAAKAKLRAKLQKEHDTELDQLRSQLDELRKGQTQQQPQQLVRPKREDFYDQDDPDDAYTEALADWKIKTQINEHQLRQQHDEHQRNHFEAQHRTAAAVDKHYERAAELAAKGGITPELYQSADYRVRSAIDGVFPGAGENITNSLIASLGEGSEKVFYKLGVSNKHLAELTDKLAKDPSGLQASMYLGRLSAELTAPTRRTSNTPPPATDVKGDMNTTAAGKALHKKYMEATKRGDAQAAFNARREAKAAKINVESW